MSLINTRIPDRLISLQLPLLIHKHVLGSLEVVEPEEVDQIPDGCPNRHLDRNGSLVVEKGLEPSREFTCYLTHFVLIVGG